MFDAKNFKRVSLDELEEFTKICTEAIVTTFKPKIREMLLKRMLRNGTDNESLGFIEIPNIDAMSNKQLLELYVKLKKEENGIRVTKVKPYNQPLLFLITHTKSINVDNKGCNCNSNRNIFSPHTF